MSISALHIFSKNTDATAALKGYQYQFLKTLETWLTNKKNQKEETIYCDYQEDIYQQDNLLHNARFRQLKLYSTNFSFADEEITMAIAHFFMLYVKGELLFDELEFVFETNASVKNEAKGNHANLLKEWHHHQDKPIDDLLGRVAALVKKVLTDYIDEETKKPGNEKKSLVQKANADFKKLTDDNFRAFARTIRWEFRGISPDEELEATISNIKALIEELPYPTAKKNETILISRLHYEIVDRATKIEVDDKAITNGQLDSIVLNIGSEEDKLYDAVYQLWQKDSHVPAFVTGQFFEVIHACEFCRYRNFLRSHDTLWKNILEQYIELPKIRTKYKREAIYEVCLLSLRNNFETYQAEGTLRGCEPIIREYFSSFDFDVFELQDALTMLMMISGAFYQGLTDIGEAEVSAWHHAFKGLLDKSLEQATDPNDQCEILAVFGQFSFLNNVNNLAAAESYFAAIPGLLDRAEFFNVSGLYEMLGRFITTALKHKPSNFQEVVDAFEEAQVAVEPWVIKRSGNFLMAKRMIAKGALYIEEGNIKYYLKALDAFHNAKMYYRVGEYIEGYILALINIAKAYLDAGLPFGAKYYALCAFWVSFQSGNPELYPRLPDAGLILFMADFRQGAWLAVLDDLELYVRSHLEFAKPSGSVFEAARIDIVIYTVAVVFAFVPIIKPELAEHVRKRATGLGWIYENRLKELVETVSQMLPGEKVEDIIFQNSVIDVPLNDLGERRTISWDAFGIEWQVNFKNDYGTNAAGEEFCALLQIVHAEMAIQDFDFHLIQAPVRINIVISDQKSIPIQEPSNQSSTWKIYIPELKANDPLLVQKVYTRMFGNISIVLQEVSLLPPAEFNNLWADFIQQRKIQAKSLIENGYQRIYKGVFSETRFNEINRTEHSPVISSTNFPVSNPNLSPKTGNSIKYDHERSIQNISGRYINTTKQIHLTLDHYKEDIEFNLWIADLREQGWKDWHIAIGLMNAINAFKANATLASRSYKKEEQRKEAFEALVRKSLAGDEKDHFKLMAVEEMKAGFEMELNMFLVRFPESLGLQFKGIYPNFEGVRKFVKERLAFANDDVPELNPLKDFGLNVLSRRVQRFDFAKTDNESPAVYYFQIDDLEQAWQLISIIKSEMGSDFVNIEINSKQGGNGDIVLTTESGTRFVMPAISLTPDLEERINAYYGGKSKSCVLAASTEMSELGTPKLVSPEELITIKTIQFNNAAFLRTEA